MLPPARAAGRNDLHTGGFMHPIARIAVSLAAGVAVVFLIDRFIWPGTLVPGIIGVVCAVVVLNLPAFRTPPRP
jgi:hypothetical protein